MLVHNDCSQVIYLGTYLVIDNVLADLEVTDSTRFQGVDFFFPQSKVEVPVRNKANTRTTSL